MKQLSTNQPATLGQRIARLRRARGLTQTQLAGQLGTTQTVVSEYEANNRRIHADMLLRVAQALNVGTDELLGRKPAKSHAGELSLKLTRRLHRIEALPPARQKMVLQTLDALLRGSSG